LIEEEKELSIT
jgi:hypothetical protein